ncbi:MAG: hypothetical protein AAF597_03755 [Bacteroidota bacterium]
MTQQGQHLAELPRYYHALRGPYLKWAQREWETTPAEALGHFRRALIGWYEARVDQEDAYFGETDDYVKAVATVYFNGNLSATVLETERLPLTTMGLTETQHPLNYLPKPIGLNERQQLMLRLFQDMGKTCRELLLMTDYHHLAPARIAEVMGVDGQLQEVEDRRTKCQLMVREGWQTHGLTDPVYLPSPADEELIDRYYSGALDTTQRWDVEARRPGDAVFRHAMELREDWAGALIVAGRQDLMETLLREEEAYNRKAQTAATRNKDVKLSPRKKTFDFGGLKLPTLETVTAVALFGLLSWLAWTTFGSEAPDRKAVAYFEPYPNIYKQYEPRNEEERDLERILYYYDRKDYLTAYDELLPVAQAYPAAPLYLGVSALALEQPGRALDWFEQIPDDGYYHPVAEWYEALAYLAEGRKGTAETVLRDIRDQPGHPFRDRAGRLLRDI